MLEEKEKTPLEKVEDAIATVKDEYNLLQQKVKNWREDTGYFTIPDENTGVAIHLDIDDGYEHLDIIRATNKMHKLNKTLNGLYRERDRLSGSKTTGKIALRENSI